MSNPTIKSALTVAARSTRVADGGVFSVQTELPAQRAFVVRFTGTSAIEDGQFAGSVEHVLSGLRRRFYSLPELMAFITQTVAQNDAR
jgi:hypothetical protein